MTVAGNSHRAVRRSFLLAVTGPAARGDQFRDVFTRACERVAGVGIAPCLFDRIIEVCEAAVVVGATPLGPMSALEKRFIRTLPCL